MYVDEMKSQGMVCGSLEENRHRKGREKSREGGLRYGTTCVRHNCVAVILSLEKRQQNVGVREEQEIMNDMKKLNRE